MDGKTRTIRLNLKKFVYLISPDKIKSSFFSDLDKVLSSNKVKFFQLRLKNVSQRRVIQIGLKFNGLDKSGKFEFYADGYCVSPNAGCPQLIESSIKTKNTADIISKAMLTGVIDPILGGVLLGALLSSPDLQDENFDHNAKIKVIGNKILLNDKPII